MVSLKKQVISEFLASFTLGLFGLGLAVSYAVGGYIHSLFEFGIMFGLIIAFVIIAFNPISGAQFNPAVTLAMIVTKRQKINTLVPFVTAQILGWGIGASLNYVIFSKQIAEFCAQGGNAVTLFICNTSDIRSGELLEILGTAVLLCVICSCIDPRLDNRPSSPLFPFAIAGLIWFLVCWCGGYTGTAINPARDFGPRIGAFIFGKMNGYDVSECFSTGVWLIYLFAPLAGGVIGVLFFDKVIAKLLPED